MVSSLRHKRSAARLISPPFPTSSSTMIFETADGHRSSGESQIPCDGYSSLFTSGFLRQPMDSPTLSSFPSPPKIIRGPFHPDTPTKSPAKSPESRLLAPSSYVSPQKTPVRRRRSSILHTTSMSASPRVIKSGGTDGGVERALDNVMKSLKVMAMGTPRRELEESRWSSSSEESLGMSEESGFWRSRKSGESNRSKITIGTVRSGKSAKSRKSRKSEDADRMDIDEDIPPVPVPVPTTPGRSRRMMNGLVKRLGLTPKKNRPSVPAFLDLPAGLPPPPPLERTLPRKSSLSTLRSALTKKSSTGTLRSVKSTRSLAHPFMGSGPTFDCQMSPPPLPIWKDGEHGEGCLPIPSTPHGRRTPKSSIGQPRLQPSTSPSLFLKDMPRRAPGTPKAESDELLDMPPMPELVQDFPPDGSEYGTPRSFNTPSGGCTTPALDTPSTRHGTPALETPSPHPDDDDAVEVISFGRPLTSRSAALKPKRLVELLPRPQKLNLGLQTPPPTGLRTKKSTQDVSAILRAGCNPLTDLSTNVPYMNTPDSLKGSPRDHIRRFDKEPNSPSVSETRPSRSGGGDGWENHRLGSTSDQENYLQQVSGTFGKPHLVKRRPVPDFTISPGKVASLRSNSIRSIRSILTDESHIPSEEWELEAYLKQLERADREREVGVGR